MTRSDNLHIVLFGIGLGVGLLATSALAQTPTVRPGTYPVRFRIWSGEGGVASENRVTMELPADGDLVLPILKGRLEVAPPAGDRLAFKLTDAATFPRGQGDKLFTWGVDEKVCAFLAAHGFTCKSYAPRGQTGAC